MSAQQSHAAFVLVTAAVLLVPGPSVMYATGRAHALGFRAGLYAVLGLESGLMLHVLAAAAGISALVASEPRALTALRWAGSAYLAWLGARALLARSTSATGAVAEGPADGLVRVFREGLLVDLVNPKTLLFVTALLPTFVDPGQAVAPQVLGLGGVVVVLAALVDGTYAFVAVLVARRAPAGSPPGVARFATGGAFLGLAVLGLLG